MNNVISYLDRFEEQDRARFSPYKVENTGRTINDIFMHINNICHAGHGPQYSSGGRGKIVAQPISDFHRLLDDLKSHPRLTWHTAHDQIKSQELHGNIVGHLRHDVDVDIRAALEIARVEAEFGIPATFYILHTAPYYGSFSGGVFRRNEAMIHVYREIQNLGHEIALHTDPLNLYINYDIDGAQAIREELKWLRDNGIEIRGTVAHNSSSEYGVENFAIFKGRQLRFGEPGGPEGYVFQNKKIPLQVLDEEELGLEYEGNDLFTMNRGLVEYACLMNTDHWFLQTNRRNELDDKMESNALVFNDWIDQDRLVEHIFALERDYFLCLSIHPVYFGLRHREDSGPTISCNSLRRKKTAVAGWPRFASNEVTGLSAPSSKVGHPEYCALYQADENGFLNLPAPAEGRGQAELRILMLGGANMSGRTLGIGSHVHRRLERALAEETGKSVEVYQAAYPGMGVARLHDWYRQLSQLISPQYVVLGIGSDEILLSDSRFWKNLDGWHPDYPPGSYLRGGNVIERSPLAQIYRRNPLPLETPISMCLPNSGLDPASFNMGLATVSSSLRTFIDMILSENAIPILLVQECGESAGLWEEGVATSERIQGHLNFRSYLAALLGETSCPIADPYPRLIDLGEHYPVHWRSLREWNSRAHRIAAESVGNAILDVMK